MIISQDGNMTYDAKTAIMNYVVCGLENIKYDE